MKFWRRSRRTPDVEPLEGAKARERAEEALTQTMSETPMFAALGASLRELREQNHFAAKIKESMRPR